MDEVWSEERLCAKDVLEMDDGGTGDGLFSIIRLAFMPMFLFGCFDSRGVQHYSSSAPEPSQW